MHAASSAINKGRLRQQLLNHDIDINNLDDRDLFDGAGTQQTHAMYQGPAHSLNQSSMQYQQNFQQAPGPTTNAYPPRSMSFQRQQPLPPNGHGAGSGSGTPEDASASSRRASLTSQNTFSRMFSRNKSGNFHGPGPQHHGAVLSDLPDDITGGQVSIDDIKHIRGGPYGSVSSNSMPIIPDINLEGRAMPKNNLEYRKQMNYQKKLAYMQGARANSLAGGNPMQQQQQQPGEPRTMSMSGGYPQGGPRAQSLSTSSMFGVPGFGLQDALVQGQHAGPRSNSLVQQQMMSGGRPPMRNGQFPLGLNGQSPAQYGPRAMSLKGQDGPFPQAQGYPRAGSLQGGMPPQFNKQGPPPPQHLQHNQHPQQQFQHQGPQQQPFHHQQQQYGPAGSRQQGYPNGPSPNRLVNPVNNGHLSNDSLMNVVEEEEEPRSLAPPSNSNTPRLMSKGFGAQEGQRKAPSTNIRKSMDLSTAMAIVAKNAEVDDEDVVYNFDKEQENTMSRMSTVKNSNSMRLRKLNLFDKTVSDTKKEPSPKVDEEAEADILYGSSNHDESRVSPSFKLSNKYDEDHKHGRESIIHLDDEYDSDKGRRNSHHQKLQSLGVSAGTNSTNSNTSTKDVFVTASDLNSIERRYGLKSPQKSNHSHEEDSIRMNNTTKVEEDEDFLFDDVRTIEKKEINSKEEATINNSSDIEVDPEKTPRIVAAASTSKEAAVENFTVATSSVQPDIPKMAQPFVAEKPVSTDISKKEKLSVTEDSTSTPNTAPSSSSTSPILMSATPSSTKLANGFSIQPKKKKSLVANTAFSNFRSPSQQSLSTIRSTSGSPSITPLREISTSSLVSTTKDSSSDTSTLLPLNALIDPSVPSALAATSESFRAPSLRSLKNADSPLPQIPKESTSNLSKEVDSDFSDTADKDYDSSINSVSTDYTTAKPGRRPPPPTTLNELEAGELSQKLNATSNGSFDIAEVTTPYSVPEKSSFDSPGKIASGSSSVYDFSEAPSPIEPNVTKSKALDSDESYPQPLQHSQQELQQEQEQKSRLSSSSELLKTPILEDEGAFQSPESEKRSSSSFSLKSRNLMNSLKKLPGSKRLKNAATSSPGGNNDNETDASDTLSRSGSTVSRHRFSSGFAAQSQLLQSPIKQQKKTFKFTKEELSIMNCNSELLGELELVTNELAQAVKRELTLESRLKGTLSPLSGRFLIVTEGSGDIAFMEKKLTKFQLEIADLQDKLNKERRLRFVSEEHALLLENGISPSPLKLNYEKTELHRQLLLRNDEVNQLQDKIEEFETKYRVRPGWPSTQGGNSINGFIKNSNEANDNVNGQEIGGPIYTANSNSNDMLESYNQLLNENTDLKFKLIPELETKIQELEKNQKKKYIYEDGQHRKISLVLQHATELNNDDKEDQYEIIKTLKIQRDELREVISNITSQQAIENKTQMDKIKVLEAKLSEANHLNEMLSKRSVEGLLPPSESASTSSLLLNSKGGKLQGFNVVSPSKNLFG